MVYRIRRWGARLALLDQEVLVTQDHRRLVADTLAHQPRCRRFQVLAEVPSRGVEDTHGAERKGKCNATRYRVIGSVPCASSAR
jgi:hypothetical protein